MIMDVLKESRKAPRLLPIRFGMLSSKK
ncbi:hypothetical protein B506_03923 [Lactobacillus delbrueckii subsp. jakobsenii ZN7a-9 = DSM 26046]|nr:hypothetical protein B506_03923 [Lactobacillus delbrueckii subsp. jakobsenii ZN7a-9 = DSM 26046]